MALPMNAEDLLDRQNQKGRCSKNNRKVAISLKTNEECSGQSKICGRLGTWLLGYRKPTSSLTTEKEGTKVSFLKLIN